MVRLFNMHEVRREKELDGLWEFMPIEELDIPKEFKYKLSVPSCWEMDPNFSSYRGLGAYRKKIIIKEKTSLQLIFKGVSHTAHVFFDGEKIAYHYNAYTPFNITLPKISEGTHEIVVLVDNRFTDESALHVPNDYYTYGGIIRAVVLQEISDIFIKYINFTPELEGEKWKANVKLYIENTSEHVEKVKIKSNLGDNKLEFDDIVINAKSQVCISKTFNFENVKTWDIKSPNLYYLKTKLISKNNSIDDYIERVGFRSIIVNGNKLLLNNKEIMLKGFNRHEDHPMFGCSIPIQIMEQDLKIMLDLGANNVRTCHYPNDELFLDLCDEMGFYVWEENHARGLSIERMMNPNFSKQCKNCIDEMIKNHYNHPSIIIWGLLNECASHLEEGRKHYKKQIEQIKLLDSSRPVTFASCQHFRDICFDLVDIVSINIYSGWYNDEPAKEMLEKYVSWINSTGGSGKPIIISEFGAGAIYGYRDINRVKWSEERQADILEETLQAYMNHEYVVGTIIWQFCDCKVTEEEWALKRPGTINNKGIVDRYRRPKYAYDTVKKYFTSQE